MLHEVMRAVGFMHVRIEGWIPYDCQIYIGGREWLARGLDEARMGYVRYDNALLRVDDLEAASRLCERFAHKAWPQYVHLHGRHAEELVVPPSEEDLRRSLSRELEHLERHVYEGDAADPYEATYAVWNGCRILHTLATGSPVVSKRSAGAWGLANLPERWHPAIHAAGRAYDGVATAEDNELLRETMPPFVEMVRERLPLTKPRPLGQPPRWS